MQVLRVPRRVRQPQPRPARFRGRDRRQAAAIFGQRAVQRVLRAVHGVSRQGRRADQVPRPPSDERGVHLPTARRPRGRAAGHRHLRHFRNGSPQRADRVAALLARHSPRRRNTHRKRSREGEDEVAEEHIPLQTNQRRSGRRRLHFRIRPDETRGSAVRADPQQGRESAPHDYRPDRAPTSPGFDQPHGHCAAPFGCSGRCQVSLDAFACTEATDQRGRKTARYVAPENLCGFEAGLLFPEGSLPPRFKWSTKSHCTLVEDGRAQGRNGYNF
mmetsp:Transcript_14704/g.32005  ORF Transcript_14704/g.32005 Transcript_14704/m.32005 type:complete len:273 (+) Transcript_14704:3652-4470(+)